jgi:hypothetical protein
LSAHLHIPDLILKLYIFIGVIALYANRGHDRIFSLNEAPLGLFKFTSDYLPYFEKIDIFFNTRVTRCVQPD